MTFRSIRLMGRWCHCLGKLKRMTMTRTRLPVSHSCLRLDKKTRAGHVIEVISWVAIHLKGSFDSPLGSCFLCTHWFHTPRRVWCADEAASPAGHANANKSFHKVWRGLCGVSWMHCLLNCRPFSSFVFHWGARANRSGWGAIFPPFCPDSNTHF